MKSAETEKNWTEERIDQLKSLWTEGLSARVIAARIGEGFTRNSVLEKVHRLRLAGRATQPRSTAPRGTRKTREPSIPGRSPSMPTAGANALKLYAQHAPRPLPMPEPKPLRLIDGRVTILHLSDKTCKWPIGDPSHDDFCFCGHAPKEHSPYCEFHCGIAYQPPQSRIRRDGRWT